MWAHKNMVVTMRANIIIQLMCEEQHMHIEMVWKIKHGLEHRACHGPVCSLVPGPAAR